MNSFSAKISNIYSPFKFKMGEYATVFCDENGFSKISIKQCEFK
jgi:hypothetical protein